VDPDRPDPDAILGPLLDGRRLRPSDNTNWSYFDDPTTNARLARASVLSGGARYRTYGKLDTLLAHDQAPLAAFAVDNIAEYFSPRLACSVFQPIVGSSSLGALCLRATPSK
jgi:hypothetical protein